MLQLNKKFENSLKYKIMKTLRKNIIFKQKYITSINTS